MTSRVPTVIRFSNDAGDDGRGAAVVPTGVHRGRGAVVVPTGVHRGRGVAVVPTGMHRGRGTNAAPYEHTRSSIMLCCLPNGISVPESMIA